MGKRSGVPQEEFFMPDSEVPEVSRCRRKRRWATNTALSVGSVMVSAGLCLYTLAMSQFVAWDFMDGGVSTPDILYLPFFPALWLLLTGLAEWPQTPVQVSAVVAANAVVNAALLYVLLYVGVHHWRRILPAAVVGRIEERVRNRARL
jgi:hypothetical protein